MEELEKNTTYCNLSVGETDASIMARKYTLCWTLKSPRDLRIRLDRAVKEMGRWKTDSYWRMIDVHVVEFVYTSYLDLRGYTATRIAPR